MPIPLIIDTDPGIDDAAAIFWVLSDPRFDVKALTVTHGNIGVDGCASNALRILEVAKRRDIPVYKGSRKPILRARISAEFAHGDDGMGNSMTTPPQQAPANYLHSKELLLVR